MFRQYMLHAIDVFKNLSQLKVYGLMHEVIQIAGALHRLQLALCCGYRRGTVVSIQEGYIQ